jgi:hypothetical protein
LLTTMHALLVGLLLAVVSPAGAGERPAIRERDAPRATDLLRAKRLAEGAARRLRLPPAHRSGWRHGGDGWTARRPAMRSEETVPEAPRAEGRRDARQLRRQR